MSNILQLINKSQTLEDKAKLIAKDTIYDLKRGNISSTTELLYRVYVCMKAFYESIGKPTMQARLAVDSPSSSDYNNTITEVKNDLVTIHEECENLKVILDQIYNQMELDQTAIANSLNNAYKKAEKLAHRIENINCSAIFLDSFTSANYFDMGACNRTPAFINTAFQYISLATSDVTTANEYATIHILDGSNGFPGNTHQAQSIDNQIKYIGESNLRMNLAEILDENSDTWFEYELFKVSENTLIKTLGLGFKYDEGISWITDKNEMTLSIAIRFDKAQSMNCLSLSPYLAADKGSLPSMISDITISDGKGTIRSIVDGSELFDDTKIYTFPKQYCKELIITFEQDTTYQTEIGHTYFKEVPHSNIDYYKTHETAHNNRVDGQLPSVSNVGIVYDDRARNYKQPSASYGDSLANQSLITEELFELPAESGLKQAYTELLDANRFLIGIRDISLTNYTYESTSEYVSINYETKKPITAVSITASEDIPDTFDDSEDWTKYYFSLNDGVDWYPIIPIGLSKKEGYTKYLVNSGTPAEFRDDHIGYLETADDNYNIRVKIEISRPTGVENAEYFSPIINEYKLQL